MFSAQTRGSIAKVTNVCMSCKEFNEVAILSYFSFLINLPFLSPSVQNKKDEFNSSQNT